jgi:hypothetical protein
MSEFPEGYSVAVESIEDYATEADSTSFEQDTFPFSIECIASRRRGMAGTVDAAVLDRAQRGVLEALEGDLALVFEFDATALKRGEYPWRVEGLATARPGISVPRSAQVAKTGVLAALEDPRVGYQFDTADERPLMADTRLAHRKWIHPSIDVLELEGEPRQAGFRSCLRTPLRVCVPRTPSFRGGEIDALLQALGLYEHQIRIRCVMQRVPLPGTLQRAQHVLRPLSPLRAALFEAWSQAWRKRPSGVSLRVELASPVPLTPNVLALARHCLFGTLGVSDIVSGSVVDLSSVFHEDIWFPMLVPTPQSVVDRGVPVVITPGCLMLPDQGIAVGHLAGNVGRLVRLADSDRSRHCYVIGSTGTGKSTLLSNMLDADMRTGRGICLLDPHGDLFEETLRRVPASRVNDVVVIDPYDAEFSVGLNVLESVGNRRDLGPTIVSNNLIAIADRLYDLQQTGGPMFEAYLRNAVLLVLAGDPGATITEVVRVFEDAKFRKHLIDACEDVPVCRFWTHQALRAGGEASLHNMAPYVTSKLNQFTNNHLIRPIVGQSVSTVRFDAVLEQRKIVLVNLAIGQLGSLDSRFLGMLVLDKICEAALALVGGRRAARQPFSVYIDEFHTLVGPTLETLLSGGRKFGVSLILAHQTLTQLLSQRYGSRVIDTVLSNTGTKLAFRLGSRDIETLGREFTPQIGPVDLQSLADFHAAARIMANGRQQPPFILSTLPSSEPNDDSALPADVLSRRSNYSTIRADVMAAISQRLTRDFGESCDT